MDKIDFIIAWVDESDCNWKKQKDRYSSENDMLLESDPRFRDWDNLQYWFRAVEKYAPWVHKIHFVTWGHVPDWLDTSNPKINIVKHEDFIPEEYLPTFNSHTIELNLHRINGLTKQFVYFNDDMFLNRETKPSDFFINDLPVDILGLDCIAFGKNSAGIFHANDVGIINDNFDFYSTFKKNRRKWLSYKYGVKVCFRTIFLLHKMFFTGFFNQHVTNSYLKSTFEEVWEKEHDILDTTCKCKFREMTNVNQWLMKYWQLASGNFMPRRKSFGQYLAVKNDITNIKKVLGSEKISVVCINDTMETEDFEKRKEELKLIFEKKLPKKSAFEK